METYIDSLERELSPLRNFILPGGSTQSALAQMSRAICRRAEREVVQLSGQVSDVHPDVIVYLNRLSDFLFVVARYLNKKQNIADVVWES
jgi:cob(I)alamin adenosyltransferase